MTRAEISQVIGTRYAANRVAVELHALVLDEAADPDDRRRALRALAELDRQRPLLQERTQLDELGEAVGGVLVAGIIRSTSAEERARLSELVLQLLRESARLGSEARVA
jgi:hypothetical protein